MAVSATAEADATADVGSTGEQTITEKMPDSLTSNRAFQKGFSKGESFFQNGGMTERVAGGIMTIAVVAIVLNELFSLQIVNNSSGPFADLITQVQNVGTAALTLIVLGFLAAAAGAVLSMFRGGF